MSSGPILEKYIRHADCQSSSYNSPPATLKPGRSLQTSQTPLLMLDQRLMALFRPSSLFDLVIPLGAKGNRSVLAYCSTSATSRAPSTLLSSPSSLPHRLLVASRFSLLTSHSFLHHVRCHWHTRIVPYPPVLHVSSSQMYAHTKDLSSSWLGNSFSAVSLTWCASFSLRTVPGKSGSNCSIAPVRRSQHPDTVFSFFHIL